MARKHKWLGLDIELNLLGTWNIGLAVFRGHDVVGSLNIFIEDNFTTNPKHFDFDGKMRKTGDASGVNTYRKDRDYLRGCKSPTWVETEKEADALATTWIKGHGFSKSFGYNSNVFDLGKIAKPFPLLLAEILKKPHVDLMPMVLAHVVKRPDYKEYWEKEVALGNARQGHPDFIKYSAELVMNYICFLYYGEGYRWKKEPHVGVEDLIGYENPIRVYLLEVLKKGSPPEGAPLPRKWEQLTRL